MKQSIFTLIILFSLASCTPKIYTSTTWETRQITADGNISEWSDPLRFYDQKTGISYSIANDNKNLYFACSISNDLLQTKILLSGLEFGIDTLGKKAFGVGIQFPTGNASGSAEAQSFQQGKTESQKRPDRSEFKLKLLAEAREINLIGFKPQLGKYISLSAQNNSGIVAAINFDRKGIMNYEAIIPFSTFYKNMLAPYDSGTVFNFMIKINQAPKSFIGLNSQGSAGGSGYRGGGMRGGRMQGGGMQGGGMRGGGMRNGGMNGGRMSGENGVNNSQGNANLYGENKTLVKLKLAYR